MMQKSDVNVERLHIAIYRSIGIGDAVLATSCMDLIEKLGVSAQVYWLGREPVLSMILSAFPDVIPVPIDSDQNHRANYRTISKLVPRADIVVDLQKSVRSQLLCHRLAFQNSVRAFTWNKGSLRRSFLVARGFMRGRRRLLPDSSKLTVQLRHVMMADCLKKALEARGTLQQDKVIDVVATPKLPTHPHVLRQEWLTKLEKRTWIGVGVGALHPGKEAPLELFSEILARTANLFEKQVGTTRQLGLVCLGDETACRKTSELIQKLPVGFAVRDLTGQTSLPEAASALREVAVFLSNDSALGHICQAVGTPAAILFGPTVEAFGYAPFQRDSRAFSAPLGCRPCTKDGDARCRYGDRRCFTSIDTEKVAAHLVRCIEAKAGPP